MQLAKPVSGEILSVQLTNPGRGYTSAPSVSISGGGGTGATAKAVHSYVTMDAPWGDPTKGMAVVALLMDQASSTEIHFDLMLSQQGPPFIVWEPVSAQSRRRRAARTCRPTTTTTH